MAFLEFNHNGGGGGSFTPNLITFWGAMNVMAFVQARMEDRPLIWENLFRPLDQTASWYLFNPEEDEIPYRCTCVTTSQRGRILTQYHFGTPTDDMNKVWRAALVSVPALTNIDARPLFDAKQQFIVSGPNLSFISPDTTGVYQDMPPKRLRVI